MYKSGLRKDFVVNRLEIYCIRIRFEIAIKMCYESFTFRLFSDDFCISIVKELKLPLLSTFLFKRATLDIYIYNSFLQNFFLR